MSLTDSFKSMLTRHGIKMIHIHSDKRFKCTTCEVGYDNDSSTLCPECFGTAYKAVIQYIDGILVKPVRTMSDTNTLGGYVNPRDMKIYIPNTVSVCAGDYILEVNPVNQKSLKKLIPPITIMHVYLIETCEAEYFNSQAVCFQCTCSIDDIKLDSLTKLLAVR